MTMKPTACEPGLPGRGPSLHCAQNRRPDRANPMIVGAAPANSSWIQVTGCDDQKSGFAMFRH